MYISTAQPTASVWKCKKLCLRAMSTFLTDSASTGNILFLDSGGRGLSSHTKAYTRTNNTELFNFFSHREERRQWALPLPHCVDSCRLLSQLTRVLLPIPGEAWDGKKEVGPPVLLQPRLSWEVFKSGKNGDHLTRYMRFLLSPMKTHSSPQVDFQLRHLPAARKAFGV